jgi:hypothetical protein
MASPARRKHGARERAKQERPVLSPERAFVVQLEGEGQGRGQRMLGRVEHLVSGEARHFASVRDLCAFMASFPVTGRPHSRAPQPVGRGSRSAPRARETMSRSMSRQSSMALTAGVAAPPESGRCSRAKRQKESQS